MYSSLVNGLWPTFPLTYRKIGPIYPEISWRQADRQTDRQTKRGGGGNNHDKNQEQQLHDEGGEVDHIDYDND